MVFKIMMFPGSELYYDPKLGAVEKLYCRLLGVPIIGLRIRLRRLEKLLPKSASSVLDAGCGRGVISRYLAFRYTKAKIDGIDSNEEQQAINNEIVDNLNMPHCKFVIGNLLDFKRSSYYDLIVSVDNLEHVSDDLKVLENFKESLVDGGTLLVHVPHYYRRWPVFKWTVNFDVPGHVRPGYHLAELKERVQSTGFKVIRSGFSYGFIENLINNLSYWITDAQEKNKIIYALLFPLMNALAWFGQWSTPKMGAGVWLLAQKSLDT